MGCESIFTGCRCVKERAFDKKTIWSFWCWKEKWKMEKDNKKKKKTKIVFWVVVNKVVFVKWHLQKIGKIICVRKVKNAQFRWHYLFWETRFFLVAKQKHQTLQKLGLQQAQGKIRNGNLVAKAPIWEGAPKRYFPASLEVLFYFVPPKGLSLKSFFSSYSVIFSLFSLCHPFQILWFLSINPILETFLGFFFCHYFLPFPLLMLACFLRRTFLASPFWNPSCFHFWLLFFFCCFCFCFHGVRAVAILAQAVAILAQGHFGSSAVTRSCVASTGWLKAPSSF